MRELPNGSPVLVTDGSTPRRPEQMNTSRLGKNDAGRSPTRLNGPCNSVMPWLGRTIFGGYFFYSGINHCVTRSGGGHAERAPVLEGERIQSPSAGRRLYPPAMKNARSLSSSSGHDTHRSRATPAGRLPQPAGVM